MRKLLLILLAFIAVFTYIRALDNPEPVEVSVKLSQELYIDEF